MFSLHFSVCKHLHEVVLLERSIGEICQEEVALISSNRGYRYQGSMGTISQLNWRVMKTNGIILPLVAPTLQDAN